MPSSPADLQAVSSSSVVIGSSSICTARIRSARIVFAYPSAWTILGSNASTSRTTIGRRTSVASSRSRAPPSSASSRSYWRFIRTSSRTITGTKTMTAHAPWVNFVTAMTIVTTAVVHCAERVDRTAPGATPAP